jgi:hypothetical protein
MSHVQVKPVKEFHSLESFKTKKDYIELKAKDASGTQTFYIFLPMEDVQKFELSLVDRRSSRLSILCENYEILVGEGDPTVPGKSLENFYNECVKHWIAGQRD